MRNRYRLYIKDKTVGISVYADHFQVDEDDIEFCTETGMYVAVFCTEDVECIKTGPTADDVVWQASI